MVKKQPKLKTESDFKVFSRLACLILLAAIHGWACLLLPGFVGAAKSGVPVAIAISAALIGTIASQLVILGFLMAMFPAGLMMRLSMVIGLVATSICAIMLLNPFADEILGWFEIYLSWIPILIAGWSIPFFVAKAIFGWSLRFEVDHSGPPPRLTVSSLLLGTTLIAVCLMLLKTGSTARVAPALMSSIACMGCGLVFAIPAALIMLSENHPGWLLIKGLSISFGPAAILFGVWVTSGTSEWPFYGVIAMSCMLLSFCVFLIGIRVAGLRFSAMTQAQQLQCR